VATGLADVTDWTVLDSDELRKDLAGLPHGESAAAPYREGLYRPEMTDLVYTALLDRAVRLLERGESVVLDASWTDAGRRARVAAVADEHLATLVELRCTAPAEVVAERVTARVERGGSASDADAAIARRLAAEADPWPTATEVSTAGSPADAIATALTACGW
jgi:predicted kinase